MHYRINIGQEGVFSLHNATAHDHDELLTLITQHSKYDDVIQVEIIEELTALNGFMGFTPPLARVGSFASYYNGPDYMELMDRFHSAGRGLDLFNEINRMAKQARRTA